MKWRKVVGKHACRRCWSYYSQHAKANQISTKWRRYWKRRPYLSPNTLLFLIENIYNIEEMKWKIRSCCSYLTYWRKNMKKKNYTRCYSIYQSYTSWKNHEEARSCCSNLAWWRKNIKMKNSSRCNSIHQSYTSWQNYEEARSCCSQLAQQRRWRQEDYKMLHLF